MNGTDRLAVLIDADNAMAKSIDGLLKEITKYGTPTVKRAYGDWTTPQLQPWKAVLHRHAILPKQQFSYTKGKNATDSALIIDAMDLLYSGNYTGFCIVSSDSDFTRLATRIRQDGLKVFGFGEKKTPAAFVAACDKFVFLEIFAGGASKAGATEAPMNKKLTRLPVVTDALDAVAGEDGWANLSALGSQISKIEPSFDSRNHGFQKLSDLVGALPTVDVKTVERNGRKILQVRVKAEKAKDA